MADSALDSELMRYFAELNEQQKQSLLQMIKSFLNPANTQTETITIEEYNTEIAEAEGEYEKGDYISHEEMVKQMRKW